MELRTYLDLLHDTELALAASFRTVAAAHRLDGDVRYTCSDFAGDAEARAALIDGLRMSYRRSPDATERMTEHPLSAIRAGPCGLLRDLQQLHQLTIFAQTTWALVGQAAMGARNHLLQATAAQTSPRIEQQGAWLLMRLKAEAPQVLLVGTARGIPT